MNTRSDVVSDSYDNALAETINRLYKKEVIRHRDSWRNTSEVEFATLEEDDWFNNRRLQKPIGNIPPSEFEKAYYCQPRESADIVQLKPKSLQKIRGDSLQ